MVIIIITIMIIIMKAINFSKVAVHKYLQHDQKTQ